MVAPTGARRSKADHPALPVTLPEILDTASACHAAGAQGFHLHIRDKAGAHSLDAGHYAEAIATLNASLPNMAIQITTESAGIFDVSAQVACIETLRPEWASVSIREMSRDSVAGARLYAIAAAHGTRIQHILYTAQDAALLHYWRSEKIVRADQTDVIIVLGRYADGPAADPAQIAPFLTHLAPDTQWMLCAFDQAEHACLREAARLGGALRVGFENSIIAPDGTPWPDNAASVSALFSALTQG